MRIQLSWQEANARLKAFFQQADLRVVQSFDLQAAREGLADPAGCTCPHHGSVQCSCQYMVFIIYTDEGSPITLVVHGHGHTTELSLEPEPRGADQDLRRRLVEAVRRPPAHPNVPAG